jgi:hypothetical protein
MARKQGKVPIEQAGSRPGCSAIEMGVSKVVVYETIRNLRLYGGIIYKDAKTCYNRIIKNLSNIALLHQELPKQIALLHYQVFSQIQYSMKHKLGVSSSYHSHNHPAPEYSDGQSACDAPARWGFFCNALIEVYKQLGRDATIILSLSKMVTNFKNCRLGGQYSSSEYFQQTFITLHFMRATTVLFRRETGNTQM